MSNPNLGWMFYKDYFQDINFSNLASSKEKILKKIDSLLNKTIKTKESISLGNTHLKATTTYPGLLLGSGYLHELPDIDAQAILGFDFDYTTGLPIIRGSSIKGVLRSAFKEPEYIQELLGGETSVSQIKELEIEIFGQKNGSNRVISGKDIFFDAELISGGKILADDYLAPHGDNPLKNPIPLRFVKVAPNITFRFDFELSDGIISKEQKVKLFKAILEDFGVGAKTNVGYGKLKIEDITKEIEDKKLEKLKKDRLKSKIENATNDDEKAIAYIEKSKKCQKDLVEKIKTLQNIEDKEYIKKKLLEKYPNTNDKFVKRVINFLS